VKTRICRRNDSFILCDNW